MSSPSFAPPPITAPGPAPLPCPFCGSAPVVRDSGIGSYVCRCENPDCLIRPGVSGFAISHTRAAPVTPEAAVAYWNERPAPPSLVPAPTTNTETDGE